jgi:glycosyltransferase involved in cell wall biosynthesis
MEKKTVDMIVPCYNESETLGLFYDAVREVTRALPDYAFRYIFVDDGSADETPDILAQLSAADASVNYISFSRNFGKEAGIYAGLLHATADYTVVIDADLQHPPALMRQMLEAVDKEGYDSCSARRVSRKGEPKIRSLFARLFYKVVNRISDVDIVDGAVDYRMMTRRVVDAVLSLSEVQRFSKGLFAWVGFRTKWVEFHNVERVAGETKWSFWKLFKYAMGGMFAFTTVPLRIASFAGMGVCLLALILLVWGIVLAFMAGSLSAFPFLEAVLLMACGGILMACGVLGEYVSQMFAETKRRPVYIERASSFKKAR